MQEERDALIGRLTSAYNIMWMAPRPVITLQNLHRHKLRPEVSTTRKQRLVSPHTAFFTLQINSDSYRCESCSLSLFLFSFFFLSLHLWMSVNGIFLRASKSATSAILFLHEWPI